MGVFEDAVLKAKVAADFAGKKTGEFVEITKLRISVAETEKKISDEYRELGKMVYKAANEHTDCTEYVQEKAAAIDALYAELTKINDKINDLRSAKKCPQCSFANQQESDYCTKCGTKL